MGISTHLKVFFGTEIASNNILLELARTPERVSFAPLNILVGKIRGRDIPRFLVDLDQQIRVARLTPSFRATHIRIYQVVLAVIFVIPGSILGAALKICLLIVSRVYRDQHFALVDQVHIDELGKSEFTNLPQPKDGTLEAIPVDIQTHIGKYLSVQDLGRISQVCKQWYVFADGLWDAKGSNLGLSPNEKAVKQLVYKKFIEVQRNCLSCVVKLGVERVLNMPIVEFKTPRHGIAHLILAAKDFADLDILMVGRQMIRTADCKKFAFRCKGDSHHEGILVIEKLPSHVLERSLILWGPINLSNVYHQSYYKLEEAGLADFLKGKSVTMSSYDPINDSVTLQLLQ